MPTNKTTVIKRTTGTSSSGSPPGNYVQRGHTITTVRETEKITTRNKRGDPIVKTKTRTVYYVDGKPVRLNWFDRLRVRFMSTYEKQAFLAEKLLKQERRGTTTITKTTTRG